MREVRAQAEEKENLFICANLHVRNQVDQNQESQVTSEKEREKERKREMEVEGKKRGSIASFPQALGQIGARSRLPATP